MADQNGEMKNPGLSKEKCNAMAAPSTSISARLPSFRAPRDLTLSASSSAPPVKVSLMTRPRKSFSPNIPVRREKLEKVQESRSEKTPRKNRERDKKDIGRGRGRGKEYVQTTGSLFGEGIAGNIQRRGGGYFGGGGGGGRGGGSGKSAEAGFMNKPVLNLDTVNHIDKEHEDQRLKEILRDDFIDDLDDVIGKEGSGDLLPVQLPMVDTGRGFKEEGPEDIKDKKGIPPPVLGDSLEIKQEPEENFDSVPEHDMKTITSDTKNIKLIDNKMHIKGGLPVKEKPPELSVAQLLTGQHEDFMFFQLPNSLPSLPPEIKQEQNIGRSADVSHSKTSNSAVSDDEEEEEKKTQSNYCSLNTLPEGQIGTLKIYKSGKTEIWFGEHRLSVNKGTQVGFLQDVVSVNLDEESRTGSMTVLGHIGHRLVCSADLEALVKQKRS
ncbi:DNA-directed RNA polymerase III subunit RPC4 [Halocaridina rubra]|uniref:DNA-directed RNA polymerase III subunit RPC4 n=1 Tax=Halocaridina rubra TaxID=373956 RepID=A0AAN8WFV7_HALRR